MANIPSNITADPITESAVTFNWDSSEKGETVIDWGTTEAYGSQILLSAGLTISAVTVTNITDITVTIGWTLSEVGTGQVEYGFTNRYGTFSKLEPSFNYSAHSQTITGLLAGTEYNFRVISADIDGNISESENYTFVTTGTNVSAAPVISNVNAVSVNDVTEIISWNVSPGSTGQVEYGLTTAYDQKSTAEPSFTYTIHNQLISNLLPGTLYHYRVVSISSTGKKTISPGGTFTTTTVTVSKVFAGNILESTPIIHWRVSAINALTHELVQSTISSGNTYNITVSLTVPCLLFIAPKIDHIWAENLQVSAGSIIIATDPVSIPHLWECTVSGTCGSVEPNRSLIGSTTDGTATFTYIGPIVRPVCIGPKIPV